MKKFLNKALLICGLVLVSLSAQGTLEPPAENNADYPTFGGGDEINGL